MTSSEIQRFTLPPLQDDAMLLLWRVASMPQEALDVVKAWGFVPKAEIVWAKLPKNATMFCPVCGADVNDCACDAETKLHFGMGHYTRGAHETAILATRGKFKVADKSVRSVFFAPRGEHSEKPEAFYTLVENLAGMGPFVELFARRPRAGWHCYGAELPHGYVWTQREPDPIEPAPAPSPAAIKRPRKPRKTDAAKSTVAEMMTPSPAPAPAPAPTPAPLPEAWVQPERLDRLQAQLAEHHVKVNMIDLCSWTPEQRQQARAWLMIGIDGQRPAFFPSACAACDRGDAYSGQEYKHTGVGPLCQPPPPNARPASALDAMRAKAKATNGNSGVTCAACGALVSERNSSRVGDKVFCSAAHALAEARTLPLPTVPTMPVAPEKPRFEF
jgi:N6-adenosine-specific RNA methylase IME4